MFEYYHGVPKQLVPDNLKTGVKKACNYDPEINKTYLELSEHYGCAVVPARSRKPRDKSLVEGTVGNASTWIIAALRHEKFFDFPSLNCAVHEKLIEFSEKPFQKKDGSRKSIFLEVDKMYYSVPYTYIQKKVDVKITIFLIEVYYNHVRICSHTRLHGRTGQYSTYTEHMPPNHRDYAAWDKDRFLS